MKLIRSEFLPDGRYKTTFPIRWHHRLRIRLANWLLKTLPQNSELTIKTTSGTINVKSEVSDDQA